jgi:hypothetical protein
MRTPSGPGKALEALELTALKDLRRRPPAAARWLERPREKHPSPTIEEVSLGPAALCALAGRISG